MNRLRLKVITIGCRANQADSAQVVSHLDRDRIEVVEGGAHGDADLVVVNTCCVTKEAERDCKKAVRRALRHDDARVVLTGCAVTALPGFAAEFPDRVFVVGGGDSAPAGVARWINRFVGQSSLDAVLPDGHAGPSLYFEAGMTQTVLPAMPVGRTRPMLKIQNGCTHFCAYCIVPSARGKETSMPLAEIKRQAAAYRDMGARELVLTGVQLGAWGTDLPGGLTLVDAVRTAAAEFSPGRVRISSLEPWSVTEALARFVGETPSVCPHFHVPMQSGSDRVLRDMRRGYTAGQYVEMAAMLRTHVADVAIGTDVLCGFPTEDEAAFEETLRVVEQVGFSHVHGFSYSARPGTLATRKYGAGDREVAKRRVRRVNELGQRLQSAYRRTHVGMRRPVLVEAAGRGLTDTFLSVQGPDGTVGELVDCQLGANEHADELIARRVQNKVV